VEPRFPRVCFLTVGMTFINAPNANQPSQIMDNPNENTCSSQSNGADIKAENVIELPDADRAKTAFQEAKQRLLNVNRWQELTGSFFANFQLTDQQGQPLSGAVEKGNLFKIDIPGPGTNDGDGFDWVYVEELTQHSQPDTENISVVVRPCSSPDTQNEAVSHFYGSESTSTFSLTRENNKVTAAIYDKNVKPNTDTESTLDQIRNSIVGTTAIMIFSKIQWKRLTQGLLGLTNDD